MDSLTFRQDFPEFSNPSIYPDSLINFWLSVAQKLLNTSKWGDLLDQGYELYIAHNVSLARQNQREANVGGQPGVSKGPIASKSIDKVNIAYNSEASIEENAGYYNLTVYGQQFIRLARMMGAGGIQIGGEGFVIPSSLWSC